MVLGEINESSRASWASHSRVLGLTRKHLEYLCLVASFPSETCESLLQLAPEVHPFKKGAEPCDRSVFRIC